MKSKYEYLFCEKENFYNLYIVERKSSIEIAKIYNIKVGAVFYLLKKFDIKPRNNQEKSKYNLNHSYFEKIDTKEKTYWLGFLFADGYINNQNYVGISLIDSDISHLEKFRDAINSNHIIHTYNCNENCFSRKDGKYCRLIFKSVKMAKDLENLGCTNNKSLTLKFPSIEKCFYKDFIRGYFDGDGSFSFSKKNTDFHITGTKEFLISIIEILNNTLDINMSEKNLYKRYNDDKNNYTTSIGNKTKTLKFLNYIYEDSSVYLDRKYFKYLSFLDFIK